MNTRSTIYYVDYEFPGVTTTFTWREVAIARSLGHDVRVISMRRPDVSRVPQEGRELEAVTDYVGRPSMGRCLPDVLAVAKSRPREFAACLSLLASPVRPARKCAAFLYHLMWACHVVVTRDLSDAGVIHAPFAAGQGSMAMFLARLSGTPLWITAHAYDLYCDRIALRRKLSESALFVTISQANAVWLGQRYGSSAERVRVVRLGVDPAEFRFAAPSTRADAARIVSVGSLNPKKGHATLLRACGRLRDAGVAFTCEIIGEGPERRELETLIATLDLDERVTLLGSLPNGAVRERVRGATVAALACEEGLRGDRDGIPVALMEAMAMGVPVISTRISGIPELIEDGVSGTLVSPRDVVAFADGLAVLLAEPACRERMAIQARRVIEERFDQSVNTRELYAAVQELLPGRRGVA
jgi:colanic acid/amylovoran biosynthesis glycosyltransferase